MNKVINIVIFVFIFILVPKLLFEVTTDYIKLNNIKSELKDLKATHNEMQNLSDTLLEDEKYLQFYREKYNLSKEDEIIFVFPNENNESYSS